MRNERFKDEKLFVNQNLTFEELTEQDKLDNAYFGYLCYNKINKMKQPNQRIDIDTYAKIRAMTILYKPSALSEYASAVDSLSGFCYISICCIIHSKQKIPF